MQIRMKKRTIPYGYRYENGKIMLAEEESNVVREICSAYLSGFSMLEIAERLKNRGIEYMPGTVDWNKGHIKRILEDTRYLGTELHPAIIDQETYDTIQQRKESRSTQTSAERKTDIFHLSTPVRCPSCSAVMNRRINKSARIHQRWVCSNADCKTVIGKHDEALLSEITDLLNTVIRNPQIIWLTPPSFEPSAEQRRLENEIGRILDTTGFDKDTLRNKLLECVSLKYESIDQAPYTAKRLKADFERSGLLSDFSAELVGRTVKEIHLALDGSVSLLLTNGQEIGGDAP